MRPWSGSPRFRTGAEGIGFRDHGFGDWGLAVRGEGLRFRASGLGIRV